MSWLPSISKRRIADRDGSGRGASRPPRVLAVASGGGHWVQLLRLRPAFSGCDVAYVTVNPAYQSEIGDERFYTVNEATRWSKFALLRQALHIAWITVRERPDTVVTTGAAPGYFAILAAKVVGARTMWIDSIANAAHLSLSGEKASRHVDRCLTQWSHLADESAQVEYAGGVV